MVVAFACDDATIADAPPTAEGMRDATPGLTAPGSDGAQSAGEDSGTSSPVSSPPDVAPSFAQGGGGGADDMPTAGRAGGGDANNTIAGPSADAEGANGPDSAGSGAGSAPLPNAGDGAGSNDPPDVLPLGASELFPLPDATGLCNDPPLRIGFATAPTMGTRGNVQVWNDERPDAPVATIDLAAGVRTQSRGGQMFQQPPAAYLDGNTAVFVLPPGALARGQRYHVTLEEGVLSGPDGPVVIDDATTWRFETASAGPSDPAHLVVGLDDEAPFCTVQGAVDVVPAGSQTPTTIEIGEGSYFGVVYFRDRHRLTVRGRDRERTRIVGTNNNNLNPSTRTRALFGADDSSELVIENLTIHNLTPQGGSQAEALRLQGCDRCIVRDANVLSFQDTLLWSGRLYAENCLIAGNVDFVWGTGAAFFQSCEIKTVGRAGYIVQARNDGNGYGYVFVDSKITSDPGITGNVLGRIDASVYPSSHVAYIDCELGPHISAAGWLVTGGGGGSLRLWEYASKTPGGDPVSTARRLPSSRQLSADEAANMRDPSVVLSGWTPYSLERSP